MSKSLKELKEIVSKIPLEPGIYLMKDENQNIIYVGKAKSLRKRVRQYFQKTNKSDRIKKMVSLIQDIEYIVTSNELEALVLECNYIKSHSPKFNVMLKDDKTYPYIKITINEKYPRIYMTRLKKEDRAMYFGPYTNVLAVKEVLNMIREIFPLKRCKYNLEKTKVKPCLYFHIGRCIAPCANEVSRQEYISMINEIVMFLQGKTNEIKEKLNLQIEEYSKKLEFEKANLTLKRLKSIEAINQKQNVSNLNENNSDIFGYILNNNTLYLQVFKIREYKVVLNDNLKFDNIEETELEETLLQIISMYYLNNKQMEIPKKIYINIDNEKELDKIEEVLNNISDRKTQVISPKKGEKLKLIKMVENNIKINIEEEKTNVVEYLKEKLNLDMELNKIECYDISNLKNEYIVGAMIRFENNKLNKKMYRKFKIKTTNTQNDVQSMYEVLSRRLKHIDDWELPDVILMDGGKTQVNIAKKALREANIEIPVFGMIKNDKHRTRGIIDSNLNEIELNINENKQDKKILNFLTFLQDEVHRFVIKYHRSLRDKVK